MSILINGMEMPKKKQVYVILNPNGLVKVLDANNVLLEEYQAVPVPAHGRLIDADVLMGVIRAHDYPLKAYFNSTDNGMFTIGIQQAVDEAPTIIPAEEG